MADQEKIKGSALLKLFAELQTNAIPLKMRLSNDNDAQLTYITDISKRNNALFLKVNSPEGSRKLSENSDRSRLRFQFTDQENIRYVFKAGNWKICREMIRIEMPEFIHRFQRRKLFRLEAPHGTRLLFNVNDIGYKLLVINVSLGGSLGVMASLTEQMEQELKPYTSNLLKNVALMFPSRDYKNPGSIVNIKYCQIKRQARNPATNNLECAFEFKEISEAEHKKLTGLFYKWQREYLRKRKTLRA